MNSVNATEFQARCLALMDEVAQTGEPLVITRNDRPVAMLFPYGERRRSMIGLHAGAIQIMGDIVSPLNEPWEAVD